MKEKKEKWRPRDYLDIAKIFVLLIKCFTDLKS